MKIYTKRGDDGTTGLFGGPRVSKADLRVATYGEVDELNSVLGVVRAENADAELDAVLTRVQSELFTLGAQLATPNLEEAPKNVPQVAAEDVEQLEREIDRFDTELEPLRAFVLPSGTKVAALLHVARTTCRRAERSAVALAAVEAVPPLCVGYLNRLSDHLFTMSRLANRRAGVEETKWLPPPKRSA